MLTEQENFLYHRGEFNKYDPNASKILHRSVECLKSNKGQIWGNVKN